MAVTAVGLIKPCLEKISEAASGRKFAILRHEAKVSKIIAGTLHLLYLHSWQMQAELLFVSAELAQWH